ncbi:uncharacterized protein LOC115891613 [Sitophilus oryzae]|uniref:Uncharacterized protein LOC115891613 n=1 Tax=Sitophilus oryzae TaxID=7048 RepID=A0A6J2YYS8_SITOR|nr:uncharacterized protein LOC115891613 [Sitophilus oryzae]
MGECEVNDLKGIKQKLHDLAGYQTQNAAESSYEKYSINEARWFKLFPDIKTEVIEEEIKQIKNSIENFEQSSSYVRSNFQNVLVPVVYEALYYIFTYSDESFRQINFNDLKEYFYSCLKNNGSPTKIAYEQQFKTLLPIVKFDVCNIFQEFGCKIRLKELLGNLKLFFQYPKIHKEDVYAILRNKLKSSDYKLISYDLVQLKERNGHLGDYFSLKVDLEFEHNIEHYNFFVKSIFSKSDHLQHIIENGCSKKEEFFYLTYLPLLQEYGLESLQNFAPQCYLSRENDLLVLDNLATAGYVGVTPNTNLDFHCLSLTISKLANFHSSCIILEELWNRNDKNPITFKEVFSEYLCEAFLIDNKSHSMTPNFDRSFDNLLYLLEKFPNIYDEFTFMELEDKLKKGWKLMFERVKESKQFRNVICHGDMHVANVLLKYYGGTICQDILLVDFQLLRYCPPVQDLLLFIYENSSKETRDTYLTKLTEQYYENLSKNLENFGIITDNILSHEDFVKSMEYMRIEAVMQSLYYSVVMKLDPKVREELFFGEKKPKQMLARGAVVDVGLESEKYKQAMKELLVEFVQLCKNGYL